MPATRAGLVATTVLALTWPAPAAAERDACARGVVYRGQTIDLDVRGADVHDVLRLLADVGRVNLVVADDVQGAVTLRLRRVPWDQALCTIVRARRLTATVDGSVYLVRPATVSSR